MDQTSSAQPTVTQLEKATTPFVHFTTVMRLEDGRYVEISCGICGANARGDPPNAFFGGLKVKTHIKPIHPGEDDNNINIRVLAAEEVTAIESCKGATVIKKRVTKKKDSTSSKEVSSHQVLPLYPTVVEMKVGSGEYVTLRCTWCEGNAHSRKGNKDNLVFIAGLKGVQAHMREAHGVQKVSDRFSIATCGTKISAAKFEELKGDLTGELFEKVRVQGSGEESRPKNLEVLAENKKRKAEMKLAREKGGKSVSLDPAAQHEGAQLDVVDVEGGSDDEEGEGGDEGEAEDMELD
jgi:hypothetical protein